MRSGRAKLNRIRETRKNKSWIVWLFLYWSFILLAMEGLK